MAVSCRLSSVAYACVPDVSTVITLVALAGFAPEGFLSTSPGRSPVDNVPVFRSEALVVPNDDVSP